MITSLFNLVTRLKSTAAAELSTYLHRSLLTPPTSASTVTVTEPTSIQRAIHSEEATPLSARNIPKKTLRIIQWVESPDASQPTCSRLVMSGRLADICAELDRMAAIEGV